MGSSGSPGRHRACRRAATVSSWSACNRSARLISTRSAALSCSSNNSSIASLWSRLGSAWRWASRAWGSATTWPPASASPSTTVTTACTRVRERICGQPKAATKGSGRARPLVSTTMPSSRSARSSKRSMVGRKSSCTVQQRHPLASSIRRVSSSSSGQNPQERIRAPSIPTSPNSLTTTANRWPLCRSNWRRSVVLPAPRKPVTTVTGRRRWGMDMVDQATTWARAQAPPRPIRARASNRRSGGCSAEAARLISVCVNTSSTSWLTSRPSR